MKLNLTKYEQKIPTSYTKIEPNFINNLIPIEKNAPVYTIEFPSGAGNCLMEHKQGKLAGLKTTSIVVNGKIDSVAGLKEVRLTENGIFILLSIAIFRNISFRLDFISKLLVDIHNKQEFKIHAKYERISHTITKIISIMDELPVDVDSSSQYLHAIISSNLDSFELYVQMREQFKLKCAKQIEDWNNFNNINPYDLKRIQTDNVFSLLNMFIIGSILEVILSNNFSEKHLKYIESKIKSMKLELIEIYKNPHEYYQRVIDNWRYKMGEDNFYMRKDKIDDDENKINKNMNLLCEKLSSYEKMFISFREMVTKGNFKYLIKDNAIYIPPAVTNQNSISTVE